MGLVLASFVQSITKVFQRLGRPGAPTPCYGMTKNTADRDREPRREVSDYSRDLWLHM